MSSSMQGKISSVSQEAEWATRCDLAALYRLMAHFRWTDHIDTHISARVPGTTNRYLINKFGVMFHEMRASDLVEVDHAGEAVSHLSVGEKVNQAGFNIHSAIHGAMPEAEYVIHTHSPAGMAVSAQEAGLLPVTQHAMKFYNRLGYHDYEGISWDTSERDRLTGSLGKHRAMIMRNHGLLATGRTAAEAFNLIYFLERACQAQIMAMSGGAKLRQPSEDICELVAVQEEQEWVNGTHLLAWDAALRLIDNSVCDYRS
ncbi:class II aldolase/adducin family protein [Pantoea sp. Ap-967]|uniref:class II aldolase/adducin family protein n=1 Tax=Pantoea sp. Ap-967 TaxID=2608362 RepID=UPI0014206C5F|nr:class II aldolase/adducin family protein [Pantoea sp. Ap-967]NIE72909.1 class II aldolase/adducin family protein [Pantoea sp. Ap-967]